LAAEEAIASKARAIAKIYVAVQPFSMHLSRVGSPVCVNLQTREAPMGRFWNAALAICGLSAVAAFVFWSLYTNWLKLPIFARLDQSQTFVLMLVFLSLTFVALVAMLYTYLAKSNEAPKALTIKGNVEFADGTPARGAHVFVKGQDGFKEADGTGWFQIQVADQESWSVKATYEDQAKEIVWPKGKRSDSIVLTLPKKPVKKLIVTIGKDIRAQQWRQASSGGERKVTSLYIPLTLENPDAEDISVREVSVRDRKSGTELNPPEATLVRITENQQTFLFQACHNAFPEILNGGTPMVVPKSGFIKTAIMVQDGRGHVAEYDLEMKFKDSRGQDYKLSLPLPVNKHSGWTILSEQ
jgi:hypothetical protein